MKETPIIFCGDMVRATLAGNKTMTRRLIKPAPRLLGVSDGCSHWTIPNRCDGTYVCPYGNRGDRLWVRETWFNDAQFGKPEVYYRANGEFADQFKIAEYRLAELKWKPSIYMPRWASRIALEIVSVRVERLQDITDDDCRAEGIRCELTEGRFNCVGDKYIMPYKSKFNYLWESINGAGSWDVNPFVWVIEFKMVKS